MNSRWTGPSRPVDPSMGGDSAPRRDESENVLRFKRRKTVLRPLRRSPLRRYVRPFLLALLIVAIPSGIVAWTMTSTHFAVREITVVTGERVSEAWVRRALSSLVGRNLPLLSLQQAEALVRRHPWVEGCALRKELPAGLRVRIDEKRSVALLRHETDLYYLDDRGSLIAPFDPFAGGVDLLLVSRSLPAVNAPLGKPATASGDGDLEAAVELMSEIAAVDPPWRVGLSEIVILGEKDFRIYTNSLPFPLLVRAGTLERKVRRLEGLLPKIVERYAHAAAVDLRFARRIIVQPSVKVGSDPRRSGSTAAYREATPNHVQRG